MATGIMRSGVLSEKELAKLPGMPSKDRLKKGPVAVIECAQEIPCDPCVLSCSQGAIEIGEDINGLPVLKEDECVGCGLCIPACPGLAIFVVDLTFSKENALVQLAHEFLPLPKKGETVECLNREGKIVSEGWVIRISNPRKNDRTPVLSVTLPKGFAQEVRAIRIIKRRGG
jgi:Fe-S-cluster-containing hydrogenase component 2